MTNQNERDADRKALATALGMNLPVRPSNDVRANTLVILKSDFDRWFRQVLKNLSRIK